MIHRSQRLTQPAADQFEFAFEPRYELKLDGYRCLAIKQDGDAQLFSRNGNSFGAKFPSLVTAVQRLRVKRCILDGEIVALDEQ